MLGLYKQIKKEIKKYDDVVIVRHMGADPDALGSQFALKELIKEKYINAIVTEKDNYNEESMKVIRTNNKIEKI